MTFSGATWGFKETFLMIKSKFYWNTMFRDIKNYCQRCSKCLQHKSGHKIKATLRPIQVSVPFDCVSTDIMGPLPITHDGNKYIIVFIEFLTKFCIAAPLPNITAVSTARALLKHVILVYFLIKELIISHQSFLKFVIYVVFVKSIPVAFIRRRMA